MEHTLTGPRRPAGLEAHLRHHWSVARDGAELAVRIAELPSDTALRAQLGRIAGEVAADCAALVLCLASAGVAPSASREVTPPEASRAGADQLADVEAVATVVVGNRLGWQCIERLALDDPWWSHYAAGHWLRRNAVQQDRVHALHPAAVEAAFGLPRARRAGLSRLAGTGGRRAGSRGGRR